MIFCCLLSLVLHELGHAFAAKCCGFKIHAIRFGVGGNLYKTRWHYIEFTVGMPYTWFVGLVEMSDYERGSIGQRLFVAVSGLLANLLLVFIAGFCDEYFHQDQYFAFLGIMNMGLIVINLCPFVVLRRSYVRMWSDGGRILGLIQEFFTGKNFAER